MGRPSIDFFGIIGKMYRLFKINMKMKYMRRKKKKEKRKKKGVLLCEGSYNDKVFAMLGVSRHTFASY